MPHAAIAADPALSRHKSLSHSHELLEALGKGFGIGITVTDPSLNYVMFNQTAMELWDVPNGYILPGDSYEKIVRWVVEHRGIDEAMTEAIIAKRVLELRNLTESPEGTSRSFNITRDNGRVQRVNRCVLSGGHCLTLTRDITRETRRELLLEMATRSDRSGYIIFDLHTGTLEMDDYSQTRFGADLIRRLGEDGPLALIHADDRDNAETVLDSIGASQDICEEIYRGNFSGNRPVFLRVQIQYLHSPDGTPISILMYFDDVTQAVERDTLLRQAHQKLVALAR